MPTPRQERLAEAIIENASLDKPLGMGELVEKVGYSPVIAKSKPGELMAREGVKEALAARGFTLEAADNVVHKIMVSDEAEDHNRLKAAGMVYERLGGYAPQKSITMNLEVKMDPKAQAIAEEYEEKLRREFE